MKRLLLCGLPVLLSIALVGCASHRPVTVGGVPGWVAEGAKFSEEPAPRRPDAAVVPHEQESGPVQFEWITDRRAYRQPSVKKAKKTSSSDPLERGRDQRVRQLFR